jgi:hypothetical protein
MRLKRRHSRHRLPVLGDVLVTSVAKTGQRLGMASTPSLTLPLLGREHLGA